ncbi:MAG: S8 family serine peptidase, partial [Kiritimatiellales bacterium]|nr:S8 family serine peptidase [Kiritimatiellales bacterium]
MAVPFISSAITTSAHTLGDLFRADLQRGLEHRVSSDDRSRLVKLKSRFFVAAPANANLCSGEELYLTFAGTPNEQQKGAMAAQGIHLVEHITKTTWRAVADKDSTLDALDSLLGAEPVWPVDKWSPDLWNRYLTAGTPDESIEVVVAFTETTDREEAAGVLVASGADALSSDFQYGQKLRVKTGYAGLLLLCGSAAVSNVELPPPPRTMDNQNAARLSHVDDVQTAPYGLTGTNINVMLRDGGGVASHPDYAGRITAVESLAVHYHSTHVAGTIVGNGSGYAAAKGMAPQAQLFSYDYNGSDADELIDAKNTYDARLSNHSYGYVVGWEATTWNDNTNLFGAYTTDTRDWDAVVHDENLYIFKSAGNDRDDTGTGYPHDGTLYGNDYYDCMGTISSAKNIITIGAVDAAGAMSTFSAFGPTDDGRIKPDLVADGVSLLSTYTNLNYAYMSGTSMSSPVA